jgi:hypothetical protein
MPDRFQVFLGDLFQFNAKNLFTNEQGEIEDGVQYGGDVS